MKLRKTSMNQLLLLALVLALLICLLPSMTVAQSVCDAVLRPTEDRSSEGNYSLYSYVNTYAEEEYDRLSRMKGDELSADATYKVFSGAFKSSKSKSEFRENVRKVFQQTGYTQIESRMKSSYRAGLQDTQIAAWENCMKNNSAGLSIVTGEVTKDGFVLRVSWRPPQGALVNDSVKIELTGGTTSQNGNQVSEISIPLEGARDFGVIIKTTATSKDIIVNALTKAFGKDLLVPVRPPVRKAESVVQECSEFDPCPENAKVIDCFTSNERPREVPGSPLWLFKTDEVTSGNYVAREILFGQWSNSQCGLSGTGWHTRIGSCEKGGGTGFQRCTKVRVQYEKITYVEQ